MANTAAGPPRAGFPQAGPAKAEAESAVPIPSPTRVGVVVAGAGARGAYEAGVLSVLLPAMEAAGARPTVFVGASAGAINSTVLAGLAHLPAAEAAEGLLAVWRAVERDDVFRSLLLSAPVTATRYVAEFVGLPLPQLTSLLDSAPQRHLAESALDWGRLAENIDTGLVDALAVVATSSSGRTTAFVDRAPAGPPLPRSDPDRALDYVAARIDASHVLASCAIPAAFPAVEVTEPEAAHDWYTDGGVRLNTPLKPALALGASHVLVVATHPATYPSGERSPGRRNRPEVDDMVVQVLEAAMVDRMVEDVRTLGTVNELVVGGGHRPYGGRDFAVVPYVFAGPQTRDALGDLARDTFAGQYSGMAGKLRAVRSPDIPLLRRLLTDTGGPREGDLLSFLYFDPAFLRRAIDVGRADAERLLSGTPAGAFPWRVFTP